ncbi:hypothetical protein BDN70DRAFT_975651 [Pholiota conissans]|uniref:Uncharacterized protein n=1 Tax=Pholiota conissans TaxID=109636 RepID=A0A9P5YQ23_9AGAR|nr:hypothetical protein BDN70DRAFT_975651 [Pholiota conissans]
MQNPGVCKEFCDARFVLKYRLRQRKRRSGFRDGNGSPGDPSVTRARPSPLAPLAATARPKLQLQALDDARRSSKVDAVRRSTPSRAREERERKRDKRERAGGTRRAVRSARSLNNSESRRLP